MRRSIQAGASDRMLTLTYRENRTDARQCHADLPRFLRLVRDALPDDYKYVAVFERQKRGAGHWHLAVAGWQRACLLRELSEDPGSRPSALPAPAASRPKPPFPD